MTLAATATATVTMSSTLSRASPAITPSPLPTPSSSPIFSLSLYASTPVTRLPALYSNIPSQKHSNPTSYHINMDWWRRVLEEYVFSRLQDQLLPETWRGSGLILRAWPGLMDIFRVESVGKPLALGAVIMLTAGVRTSKSELRDTKAFVPLTHFLTAKESVYASGWLPTRIAAFVLGKPLWWALEQLGIVGEEVGGSVGTDWWNEYVVLALVEKAADAVLSMQAGKAGGPAANLYTFEGFRREFSPVLSRNGNGLGVVDATVILKFLERDRRAVSYDSERGLIKFISAHSSTESREINAVDRGILELKTAVENLLAQIDGIQPKIDESTRKASSALRQKQKAVALSYLRSRKQLEEILTKRIGSLEILENMLMRVETAAGDIEVIKSYESSTATLRAILAHPSLKRDKIDETMEAMAEASADARDVQDAIQVGGNVALGIEAVDDVELERELEDLVGEIATEQESKEELEKMEKLTGVSATPTALVLEPPISTESSRPVSAPVET